MIAQEWRIANHDIHLTADNSPFLIAARKEVGNSDHALAWNTKCI